ncbi:MAG: mechanosensitive ion channel family protein [Clostridiales bacterium]|nr:mechanosensitive ion channel family protein [Clostridiales bacterium]
MENLSDLMTMSVGGYSLGKLLSAGLTLLICLLAVRLIMKAVQKIVSRAKHANERLQKLIVNSVKALLYVLTVIIAAGALGVNTTSLTAIMSVLTLGVTMAAQDILGNVAGGLVLLSTRPFSIGDVVEIGGTVGTVREINLNHTRIETPDGQIVLQPNSDVSGSKIVNYTALGRRRVVCRVSASYDAPAAEVKAACLEAVSAAPNVLGEPAPDVFVSNYGSSSIEYTVRCWTKPEDYWETSCALNENLRDTFAGHNVEMTYDHLNVHIVEK